MAEQNVPPPPQPVQPRRRTWLWVLIGAGGCLLIIFIAFLGFAGCTAALIGGATSGSGEQSPQEKYAAAKERAAPVGETVTAGSVAWTVRSVEQSTELKSYGSHKR